MAEQKEVSLGAAVRLPAVVAVLSDDAIGCLSLAGEADMIELRLDLIASCDPLEALRAVRVATSKPIIATVRLQSEGGGFLGSEEEREDLLIKASGYADYVDVELLAERRDEVISGIKKPVIVSYHDFDGMPDETELAGIYGRMKRTGARIAKIALTPQNRKDNLTILRFLLDADMPLCLIGMGEQARHLRALAPLYGSALTYAYVAKSTAPGQMSLHDICLAMRLLQ
jgi:3-dehydroquinate dehydratase I